MLTQCSNMEERPVRAKNWRPYRKFNDWMVRVKEIIGDAVEEAETTLRAYGLSPPPADPVAEYCLQAMPTCHIQPTDSFQRSPPITFDLSTLGYYDPDNSDHERHWRSEVWAIKTHEEDGVLVVDTVYEPLFIRAPL